MALQYYMEGADLMDELERILSIIDEALDTKRKHHIVGGILLSTALLFWRLGFHCYNIARG